MRHAESASRRLMLSGADVVLPDRILSAGTIVIEGDRIADVCPGTRPASPGEAHLDLHGHVITPGFVDTHVHGVEGCDVQDAGEPIAAIASRLARHGVTAFCPTTVACPPAQLARVLAAVGALRAQPAPGSARVLPAHVESNFLNPDYRGAQPLACLRLPPGAGKASEWLAPAEAGEEPGESDDDRNTEAGSFAGADIVAVIERHRADVGVVTLAPELPGALELVRTLRAIGPLVSLGHSGATFEQGLAALEAGATRGTHLFNRMPPLGHREPGLSGAMLASNLAVVEMVCDGLHVHPAMLRLVVAAKGREAALAISDGLSAAGLPPGARASLGGRAVTVGPTGARLEDGTLAGSALTLGQAFGVLVSAVGLGLVDAVHLCATSPARSLGLRDLGLLAPGVLADLVVFDARLSVRYTFVAGLEAFGPGR